MTVSKLGSSFKSGNLSRTIRVAYPANRGTLVLRCQLDWNQNLYPTAVNDDGTISTFEISTSKPFLYFKPCLIEHGKLHWSVGANHLLLMTEVDGGMCFPYFFTPEQGRFSELIEIPSPVLGHPLQLRIYLPPGYYENTLATYPVAYMQDGQNLFFPQDAFQGKDWKICDTSQTLRAMRAVEDFIIVGIHSGDRGTEYTKPGYEFYARALVEDLVPREQSLLRSGNHRRYRFMVGSSLGGVVSFYTVWQHSDVFGSAICMSSTFSHQDDLLERVLHEAPRDVGFYLDSGWPGDNYEVTLAMAAALITRGWRYGHNLLHFSFPQATHHEQTWGVRLHLPIQFFTGSVARAARRLHPVLGDRP